MTGLLVAVLAPPAVYGVLLLAEQHTLRWRARHRAAVPDCPACRWPS